MGRGKLNMELIRKERSRILTFKKRKEGLMKKLHELTTLCDVRACMIIYGPVQESGAVGPEIWPQNPDKIRRIIDAYKAKNKDSRSKSFGLSDFFQERKKKVEEELVRLRKKNMEAKYPTWNEFLSFLNEAELRGLAAALNNKVQIVKSRIEFLKRKKQEHLDMDMMNMMMMMDFAPPNLSQFYPTLNHHHRHQEEIKPPIIDMGSMIHNNSSGNCASFAPQVFYEATATAGHPMIYHNHPLQEQLYYAPPMLPPPPPYMHWPMISGVAPPAQLQLENLNYHHDDGGEDDIIQYLLQFN